MRHLGISMVLAAAVALPACSGSNDSGGGSDEGDLSSNQRNALMKYEEGSNVAVALFDQFAEVQAAIDDKKGGPTALVPDYEVQAAIGDSVAVAIDTGPSCVSFAWGPNLTATVTFDKCTDGSHTIDGTLSMAVTIQPTVAITLTLGDLQVDGLNLDGAATMSFGGTKAGPVMQVKSSVTLLSGSDSLSLDEVAFTLTPSNGTLNGDSGLTLGNMSWQSTATAMNWAAGQCHPSSGSLSLDDGKESATAVFLPKTPATGIVEIEIPGVPAFEYPLLSPCPS
jgi:hypothetical protein